MFSLLSEARRLLAPSGGSLLRSDASATGGTRHWAVKSNTAALDHSGHWFLRSGFRKNPPLGIIPNARKLSGSETGLVATSKYSNRKEIVMKHWSAVSIALLLFGLAAFSHSHQAFGQTGAGWVTLFDGKNLDNWNKIGGANWRLEDGAVVADKGDGFLVSKNAYTDFQLRAEFWVDADANSGIFIRCTDPDKVTGATSYEVNIWDTRPEPSYGTGAIVNVAKVDPMPRAGGKWNVYEITAKGSTFTVTLNGQKTVDGAQDAKFATGRIALQHGLGVKDDKGVANDRGVVKFRKVEIKPL
jgi:hypothetical protein